VEEDRVLGEKEVPFGVFLLPFSFPRFRCVREKKEGKEDDVRH